MPRPSYKQSETNMALELFPRFREQTREGDGGAPRPTPAEVNDQVNRGRLSRIEQIASTTDGQRAEDLTDVEGDGRGNLRTAGRFAGGEFDDSPAARERRAAREDELARQAIDEQEERAREAERLEAEEARRLQEEGGTRETPGEGSPGEGEPPPGGTRGDDGAEERLIDGVRYYRTIVAGEERWLTLKELREGVARGMATEDTLRRAQEALASASHAQPTPKGAPAELDDKELENIVLSAGMGDEEAVRKLVSVIKARTPAVNPQEVSRLVSQQIATQRAVEDAEYAQRDILEDARLAPEFRRQLGDLARTEPTLTIGAAYERVGAKMRKDFEVLLKARFQNGGGRPIPGQRPPARPPANKAEAKRTLSQPPSSAGRQPPREAEDREVPVSEQIDAIARGRGQDRAHRIRRS